MARRFYLMQAGKKLVSDSLEIVQAAAQALANVTGKDVLVGLDDDASPFKRQVASSARPKRKKPAKRKGTFTARRNPEPSELVDHMWRMKGAREDLQAAAAKAAARARAQASRKYLVRATSRKESYQLTRKGKAAADDLADQFRDAGFKVTVSAANPLKRGGPLKRSTPLKRKTPLRRGKALRRS